MDNNSLNHNRVMRVVFVDHVNCIGCGMTILLERDSNFDVCLVYVSICTFIMYLVSFNVKYHHI